jgi:2Fe-2S ferredoxin
MTAGPSAATIIYVQPDGTRRPVMARVGQSVMEAALRADVPGIEAKCRGNCACVTCHVYIDPGWAAVLGPRSAMEESMLDFAEAVDARSRLACQIRINAFCDGLVVATPVEQRVLGL